MKKLVVVFLFIACARDPVVVEAPSPAEPPPRHDTVATTTSSAPAPAPAAPVVSGPKLAFVDEAAEDPTFAAYRDRLLAAVRARDIKTVLALSDPNVRTSFGGGGGRADLEQALQEEVWGELEQILSLGGTFRDGMFWAPYVYSAWPDSHDAFESLAVIADDVSLRRSADASAPAIATLSRDVVERASAPGAEGAWTKITTADGKTGFVETKLVRSPIDYRAGFTKRGAEWRMTALVAGD